MSKSDAIRKKCLECEEGPKGVTLCPNVDCPLWIYRFGYSSADKRYKTRMEVAKKKYPEEYQDLLKALSEYKKNKLNLRGNEQINAFLNRKSEKEDNSIK